MIKLTSIALLAVFVAFSCVAQTDAYYVYCTGGTYCYSSYSSVYCCGYNLSQCCYYQVYQIWWFWIIWVIVFLFIAFLSCCIRRRRQLAFQRAMQQQQTLPTGGISSPYPVGHISYQPNMNQQYVAQNSAPPAYTTLNLNQQQKY